MYLPVRVADILRFWNDRRENAWIDFLYAAGFYGPDSPLRQKLMN